MKMDSGSPQPMLARRFTLLDAMILVAATALGCGLDSWLNSFIASRRGQVNLDPIVLLDYFGDGNLRACGALALPMVIPILAAWTLALIPLHLIGPRSNDPGPGWFASWAFVLFLVFALAVICGSLTLGCWPGAVELLDLSPLLPIVVAMTILSSWVTLVLARCWRPEPTWLDRSGRTLGVCWLILAVTGPVLLATANF